MEGEIWKAKEKEEKWDNFGEGVLDFLKFF